MHEYRLAWPVLSRSKRLRIFCSLHHNFFAVREPERARVTFCTAWMQRVSRICFQLTTYFQSFLFRADVSLAFEAFRAILDIITAGTHCFGRPFRWRGWYVEIKAVQEAVALTAFEAPGVERVAKSENRVATSHIGTSAPGTFQRSTKTSNSHVSQF